MTRPRRRSIALGSTAIALVVPGPVALAAPAPALATTICNETIAGQEVRGTLIVPADGECTLQDTSVSGGVHIGPQGALYADDTVIRGDVRAAALEDLVLANGTTVRGSVTVSGGTASIAINGGDRRVRIGGRLVITDTTVVAVSLIVRDADIDGSLTIAGNELTEGGDVSTNRIGGAVTLDDNDGSISVSENRIGGSLRCRDNRPPPVVASNTVAGRSVGQCAVDERGA